MASRRQRALLDAGTRAPDFRLSRLEGGEASFAELAAGRPVLLVFFKVTCPVCQLTMPFLERLHASGALTICGISQNDAPDTREFNGYFGVSFATLLDAEDEDFPASNAYGISSVPSMFRVEPDGVISRVIEGWNKKEMASLAEDAGVALFRPEDDVPAWKAG
jgi:peroxiredoxin